MMNGAMMLSLSHSEKVDRMLKAFQPLDEMFGMKTTLEHHDSLYILVHTYSDGKRIANFDNWDDIAAYAEGFTNACYITTMYFTDKQMASLKNETG